MKALGLRCKLYDRSLLHPPLLKLLSFGLPGSLLIDLREQIAHVILILKLIRESNFAMNQRHEVLTRFLLFLVDVDHHFLRWAHIFKFEPLVVVHDLVNIGFHAQTAEIFLFIKEGRDGPFVKEVPRV